MASPPTPSGSRPALGHVNLMADTLIANATPDDLRAIIRSMVSSATPGIAAALNAAARERLSQTAYTGIPTPPSSAGSSPREADISAFPLLTPYGPTPHMQELLRRARALYGSGMGFASLGLLAHAARSTLGLRWDAEGEEQLTDILALLDADMAQAVQSCKEEVDSGRVHSWEEASFAVSDLRAALRECEADCASRARRQMVCSGEKEFAFERAMISLNYWEVPVLRSRCNEIKTR
ncbi:hypothetical protein MIND_00928900 [Mycena indigotica]|uniref:Uncharacterized protein n=1 Tax=Mycena indigotica TaxID=2126181 RepID=A0A8H6SCK4_9AGAR|nr:uncharacterized protein MIND_00928900 [Mycena indigotica]KAF7296968.1 hypothetical protein MIND_00928900 [Mycena indigotica]